MGYRGADHESECGICGARSLRRYRCALPEGGVFQCAVCEGESVEPLPTNQRLTAAYQHFGAGRVARDAFSTYCAQAKSILEADLRAAGLSWESRGGSRFGFLDYGCGGGHFVKAAQELGFSSYGIDVDDSSRDFGQRQGLAIASGNISDLATLSGNELFHVILMMHVVEHLPRPLDVLRQLVRHLAPGGCLIIGVPDQGSVPSLLKKILRAFGIKRAEWGFVQPPIHLHGLTLRTIRQIGLVLGLEVLSTRKTSPLDPTTFPASEEYWIGLRAQRAVYRLGRWCGSGGHIKAILTKPIKVGVA